MKKIHLFPSEKSYLINCDSVEPGDLALVPLSLSFNDLSDKPKAYVTETWSSGTQWYRKWSDGFIEQGGEMVEASTDKVTLHTPYKSTNYCVQGTPTVQSNLNSPRIFVENKTTTSFTLAMSSYDTYSCAWYAYGY